MRRRRTYRPKRSGGRVSDATRYSVVEADDLPGGARLVEQHDRRVP